MIEKKDVYKALLFLRNNKDSISWETIDFMSDVSNKAIDKINEFGTSLSIEEIVKQPGWYVSDSFDKGVCLDVDSIGYVDILSFKNKEDILPTKCSLPLYSGLFKKKFKKVFNKFELFE